MADSEVLSELKQLRGQVRDLNLARSGHDDVVRDLGDAIASLKKENAELREQRKRGVPASPVPLPRRREGAWTQVKNKETGWGRPQTPPPATRNSFAALVDECTEEGDGKTVELSLSSGGDQGPDPANTYAGVCQHLPHAAMHFLILVSTWSRAKLRDQKLRDQDQDHAHQTGLETKTSLETYNTDYYPNRT
ncbi:hypothetical protein GWK47_019819 [Chionoecetes opilio]|uniref:Uncharacterized protein n=1 Tax=Chionoecetes opilio TaxID=41210 RepID=A0A8J4XQJ7_CHIOP|nr:hypothetical protein GWK47_019819 [Chionoecetes opilio]